MIQTSYANRFSIWAGLAQASFAGAVLAYLGVAANYLTSEAAKPSPPDSNVIAILVSTLAAVLTILGILATFMAARSTRRCLRALRLLVQFE